MSGHLAEIRCSVCISQSQIISWVSFSRTDSVLLIYYSFVWSNLNLFKYSKWMNIATLPCLFLNSFVLMFCIRLLSYCLLRLYYHIKYIGYLLCLFYFYFNIVGLYDLAFCCYEKRFSLTLEISLSYTYPSLLMQELLVCCLKCPLICYDYYFCFLVIVQLILVLFLFFLIAVISLSLLFFMSSFSRRFDASTPPSILANPLPLWSLDVNSLLHISGT